MEYTYEKLVPAHENDVMHIFNHYTQNSFAAYPEGVVPNLLFLRFLEIGKTHPAYAITSGDGTVVGFCLLRPYNPFAAFKETAEVSYFIRHDHTGKGIGKSALRKLEEDAKNLGIRHLLADISSENRESIEFHERNGFTRCGYFNNIGKKFGKTFSVVWMEKELK
jgi:L-amino acid N-acyltransferase YncA